MTRQFTVLLALVVLASIAAALRLPALALRRACVPSPGLAAVPAQYDLSAKDLLISDACSGLSRGEINELVLKVGCHRRLPVSPL